MGRQSPKNKIYVILIIITLSALFVLIPNIRSDFGFILFTSPPRVYNTVYEIKKNPTSKFKDVSTALPSKKSYKRLLESPSSLMEQTRRKIGQTIQDQWLFLLNQIHNMQKLLSSNSSNSNIISKSKNILQFIAAHGSEYNSVLQMELKKLASEDGFNDWRLKEAQDLKEIVQERIFKLQNPGNCSEDPVLVCNLDNPSGFASGVHDVLWCFIKAYKEQRRLVLLTRHWHYEQNGWEMLFLPLSETCGNKHSIDRTIACPIGRNSNKARWIMRALPQDLGPRIIKLYGDPLAWWYGQFLYYLMRPNPQLNAHLEHLIQVLLFSEPIAAIHVRRTDKIGSEATLHDLEEYMEHVEAYFKGLEMTQLETIKRRVYIATDDPRVLIECFTNFPMYECLYYNGSAEMALTHETRYSNASLLNLVIDIFLMSSTDYLVCTQSSGMCRLAYELKQALVENLTDASDTVLSLDIPHHYAYVTPPARKAIYNHKPKSTKEIPFERGNILTHKDEYCTVRAAVRGKMANGFVNMVLKEKEILEGLIPMYKTRKSFELVNFAE
ncbi:hypothetical protein JTE90_026505 [Oedothorax gibbosus]|uniref:GT23 domain-containing protein n=1 Tax=Oedothorax gibbosus TaxID=931172 RepID=A0AAV6VRC8_9ARAC|nr:hypothetical protein JTE90_026505 [Oedothorax gibbosus]